MLCASDENSFAHRHSTLDRGGGVRDARSPRYRPHSPLGQDGEHALAFILVGLAVGLAFPQRRLLVAVISVALIGLLEIMQFWAPGRHARLEDFVVDAVTACIGLASAAVIGWLGRRWRGSRQQ